VTISAKEKKTPCLGARDRSDSQEHGERMGATADGNGATYLRRERDEPPGDAKEAACGRICGEKRGVFLARSFCPHNTKMTPEKLRFFQRGKWTKSKRRGSFSGRGNDRTNIIKKHS